MDLNQKEQQKYLTIKNYIGGRLTRKQASIRLDVSLKTVSVLKAGYLKTGKNYFCHGLNGAVPRNRIGLDVENAITGLYRTDFNNFNFTHFYEYIASTGVLYGLAHGEYITARTVARILERNGITSPQANKTRRKSNQHPTRPRRLSFGELVQLDASNHDWLSLGTDRKISLHLAIDDATSQLLGGYFCRTETLIGYFTLLYQILNRYGIPKDFYTDRRTVFEYRAGLRKEDEHIQFKNSCKIFGIGIIATSIAEAKGRVERSFRTHQDRLVNELKLAGTTTIAEANKYLIGYIERHNSKYALKASENGSNAFRQLDTSMDINKVLSVVTPRTILNGNVVSFKSRQYYLVKDDGVRLLLPVNTQVEVVETFDEKLFTRYNCDYYEMRYFADGRLTAHLPSSAHPWKQAYGQKLSRRKNG